MTSQYDTLSVLRQVAQSPDLSTAIALIPDCWNLAIVGPSLYGRPKACASIIPAGLPADHTLIRQHEDRGRMLGRGKTRHEAIVQAAEYAIRTIEFQREQP
ncbi:hypothetical protein [Microvirga massiliensis]|uniref:hypothetical protein n=1 Tax=Microvirga massiliensis TaxID=1033741 RepID=UPI00062B382C|nr:hypothetical protein [Microvirga massiliensis]